MRTLLAYARACFLLALWYVFDRRGIGLHRDRREFVRAVWADARRECQ